MVRFQKDLGGCKWDGEFFVSEACKRKAQCLGPVPVYPLHPCYMRASLPHPMHAWYPLSRHILIMPLLFLQMNLSLLYWHLSEFCQLGVPMICARFAPQNISTIRTTLLKERCVSLLGLGLVALGLTVHSPLHCTRCICTDPAQAWLRTTPGSMSLNIKWGMHFVFPVETTYLQGKTWS